MSIALLIKNKLGFINGSIVKPDDIGLSHLNAWIRNNNIVISGILNSVSKEISASIIFNWRLRFGLIFKIGFNKAMGPRIFQLCCELINLKQDQQSVSLYFTKLKKS